MELNSDYYVNISYEIESEIMNFWISSNLSTPNSKLTITINFQFYTNSKCNQRCSKCNNNYSAEVTM